MNFLKKHKYTVIGGIGLFVTLVYALVWNPTTLKTDLIDEENTQTIILNEEPILLPVERKNEARKNFEDLEKQVLGAKEEPTWEKIQEVMIGEGFYVKEADYITDYCSTQKNGKWCAMLATAIADHETHVGLRGVGRSHKNNLFGIQRGGRTMTFANRMASFEYWVDKYIEMGWYKYNCEEMITIAHYASGNQGAWIENCELTMVKFYQ